jgi:3-phenylpropionate/trans-cinnamate dioxygenase ferredoxin reductase subunit
MQKHRAKVVDSSTKGVAYLFKKHGIEHLEGEGGFVEPGVIDVTGTDSTTRVRYGAAIVATGSAPIALPGTPFDGQRVISSTEGLALDEIPKKLVVVGGGYIGLEMGSVYQRVGTKVTVVEALDTILPGMDPDLSKEGMKLFKKQGLDVRVGTNVTGVDVGESGVGVTVAGQSGEETIEADAVLVGIGIQPNVELAEAAGLEVDNGVVVDAACRTSAPAVFACGDMANHDHPVFGRRIRVEHFDNALKMGTYVAGSMLGEGEPFTDPHWFWSDQYDVNLQYAGFAYEWDEIVVRGSMEGRDGVAFYLKDGVLLGALGLNRGKEIRRSMKLIGSRPDRERLRDEGTDLRTLDRISD